MGATVIKILSLFFVVFIFTFKISAAIPPAPETPKRPVTDQYQGVQVTDNYRWLEESGTAEVKKWTENQNARTHAYLDQLTQLSAIKEKLQAWNDFQSPRYQVSYYCGKTFFVTKLLPPKNQPFLVAMESLGEDRHEKIVVDPNTIDPTGKTAIDFYEPSLDGKYLAVSLSQGGSEIGTLHVYEVASGKELKEQIEFVNKPTAGGSVAWNGDGSGFYYTRYPRGTERPKEDLDFFQQIYFHKVGTSPSEDVYSLGKDFPRIAEVHLAASKDGKYVLATVANGDGGEFSHYVLGSDKTWKQITQFKEKIIQGVLGLHDDLFLLSRDGSPRGKILKLSLSDPQLKSAHVIVNENQGVVTEMIPTETRFYVTYLNGGPSEVSVFNGDGKALGKLKVPPISDISGVLQTEGDDVILKAQSYVQPPAWYAYDSKAKNFQLAKTALVYKSPVDFSDIEVKREMAKSKDGAQVPVTILFRKGVKRDGKNPTILYGYGGYGVNLTPRFQPDLHLWLEHGGIYAVANLRGGGEFGEEWHLAGNLTKKQNVFDDFIGAAEHLISRKYTSPKELAIEGGSNGGLLMGAVLTQRPDLFHVVVSHVGIYDMLRVEHDPNGAFNVTEFGTIKNPDEFKALYAYSPYHHVVNGTAYPPVLLLTGANDGRVDPYHSKKMLARLQEANPENPLLLLRVTFDGGHGIGRSTKQKVAEEADVYAFLFDQLKMK